MAHGDQQESALCTALVSQAVHARRRGRGHQSVQCWSFAICPECSHQRAVLRGLFLRQGPCSRAGAPRYWRSICKRP